jgi:hypothetical protein
MSEERAVQQVLARYVRGTDARDGAAAIRRKAPATQRYSFGFDGL